MAWGILIAAGGLEVFWATFMKLSEGFTKPLYTVLTFAGMAASFLLLARATRTLPLGTAYAVWTGIGAVGAAVTGIVLLGESASAMRIASLASIVIGIIGLKISAH